MNIDDLTLGQLKEIKSMCGSAHSSGSNLYQRYVGKYVICRSRNEGVNSGVVVEADDTGVILKDARRLFYHRPINKNISWYEGVAISGLDSRSITGPACEKIIVEDYSLTLCTAEAEKSIREAKDNAQS